jgi:serine O-acetyltransferase
LGPGAKLFGAVELGDGCIVGANAVVTKSFPTRTVIGGVPARALRIRRPGDRPDEADAAGT